ncbi:unnamed protein product [Bodo saltans]|uniref:Uncharacterized protein n=1 Tax=Bodo saltans TaxID=75058 RepID=A0A0S4JKT6_BODSA|nr:unnamed protein product [Bodo saltans]|eukprot:CUG92163.1 unnamed protein product [Bodo saltans]
MSLLHTRMGAFKKKGSRPRIIVLYCVAASLLALISLLLYLRPLRASSDDNVGQLSFLPTTCASYEQAVLPPEIFCVYDSPDQVHPAWSNTLSLTEAPWKTEEQRINISPHCQAPVTLLRIPNVTIFHRTFRQTHGRCMGIIELSGRPIPVIVMRGGAKGDPSNHTDDSANQLCLLECLRHFCCVGFSVEEHQGDELEHRERGDSKTATKLSCHIYRCFYHDVPSSQKAVQHVSVRRHLLLHPAHDIRNQQRDVGSPLFLVKHRKVHPIFMNPLPPPGPPRMQQCSKNGSNCTITTASAENTALLSLRITAPFGSIIYVQEGEESERNNNYSSNAATRRTVVTIKIGVFQGLTLASTEVVNVRSVTIEVQLTSSKSSPRTPPLVLCATNVTMVNNVAELRLPRDVLLLLDSYAGSLITIIAAATSIAAAVEVRPTSGVYSIHRRATLRELTTVGVASNDVDNRCQDGSGGVTTLHLKSSECCIGNLIAAHHTVRGMKLSRSIAGGVASDALAIGVMVVLRLANTSQRCWKLVEGYYSQYGNNGRAPFTHLILQRRCSKTDEDDGANSDGNAALQFVFEEHRSDGPMAYGSHKNEEPLRIPLHRIWQLCSWDAERRDKEEQRTSALQLSMLFDPNASAGSSDAAAVPLLISITAHRCVPCILDLLDNIAVFASPAIVVLHINPDLWVPTSEEVRVLTTIRPQWSSGARILAVHVNGHSLAHEVSLFLDFAHYSNVAFMRDYHPREQWSHVLFVQQNERFVKRGVVDYIRQFDASLPVPTQAGGITFGHFSEFPQRVFVTVDDMFHVARHVPFDRSFDSIFEETSTLPLMRRLTGKHDDSSMSYPTSPILVEGSYFSHALAMEVALAAGFVPRRPPPSREEFEREQCPSEIVSEYSLSMVLREVCKRPHRTRCGERVSVLMWSDTFRELMSRRGELLPSNEKEDEKDPRIRYGVTAADVRRARCSPIGPPFAMKRFRENSAADVFVKAVASNSTRANLDRDAAEDCEHD